MSIASVDARVSRKKIQSIEAKAGDILVSLVDGQVLRFFAEKGTGKVEVEIVGNTKPLTAVAQGQHPAGHSQGSPVK